MIVTFQLITAYPKYLNWKDAKGNVGPTAFVQLKNEGNEVDLNLDELQKNSRFFNANYEEENESKVKFLQNSELNPIVRIQNVRIRYDNVASQYQTAFV